MSEFDRIDRRILDILQADGRISNADLAERVGLSASACLRRVRELEKSGVIERYVMLVDQARIGRPTNVFVEISLQSQAVEALDAFEAAVAKSPEVMECYLMAGDADYLLRVTTAGAEDYERVHRELLARLPGVARVRTIFALRTICKRTAFKMA